jgi:hypothetical protein
VGDFKVGQEVMVSKCNVRYSNATLHGPESPYTTKPLGDAAEVRGYDGTGGSWMVFLLEIDGADPLTFRWSDDLARTWKGTKVPVTFDWQPLSGGTEVRFSKQEWKVGHMVTFTARDQLLSTIEKIEGNTLTLRDPANRSVKDAVVRHCDSAALQAAIDRALKEKRNLFFPNGHYRLATGLRVNDATSICIEGASSTDTLLDISEGTGSCFALHGGTEVTIRNFRMVGHTGLAEAAGAFRLSHGRSSFWACALKGCNAVGIFGTERVLVENVHASRMASECFYSAGPCRMPLNEPKQYTKQTTYLRCSVTDCAANAFNNNDLSENTSVLYCRIDTVGGPTWHAYEGPGRFIRLIGNYVRNAPSFTVGDLASRPDWLHELGCGQAVIRDNVFESVGDAYSAGIRVNHGSSQVVIANNLFINYNGLAIDASSGTERTYPSNTVTITGNIIDMTHPGEGGRSRTGIRVTASNTIVSDNQVYVRGQADPQVTGIYMGEPALNVRVHDNLVRNCGWGVRTGRASGRVTEVIDGASFLQTGVPLEWRLSHLYRGWNLAWLSGSTPNALSTIDSFDPETLHFKLTRPHEMKAGDRFEVFPPDCANWDIHDNTVAGCLNPVVLDSYGSETSFFNDNIVTREGATGVEEAVAVHGRFQLLGNHISGFDEAGSSALGLHPDPIGRMPRNLYRENTIERCANAVAESQKGLWKASTVADNLFLECGAVPATGKQSAR